MDRSITPTVIGDHPLAKDAQGALVSRIATVFPYADSIVTIPGIHATQRVAFVEILNRKRESAGLPPLSEYEQNLHWENSVDLVMEGDNVLIRPDPDKMDLAFDADELLQEIVPKHKIRFLHAMVPKVRSAIKRRGECWRINPLPRSTADMDAMIRSSRIAIGGEDIYYYNHATGTRILTCGQFAQLGDYDEASLRVHLSEIQDFSSRCNRHGYPEIAFFRAGEGFSSAAFQAYDFYSLSADELRDAFVALRRGFADAVRPEYRTDSPADADWRSEMFAALIGNETQPVCEEVYLGMSSEFYMQIEWLPGGRIVDGELIFDSVFDEPSDDPRWARLCDDKVKGFIFNFIREYGDVEYINIGRVPQSLSRRPVADGRRDVYIAEILLKGAEREVVRIIRMVKWGIREHLQRGWNVLDAIMQAEEYIEYILDRRLGCRQLGMNLPARIVARKINEQYEGVQDQLHGRPIWATYIERDYVRGMATDKIAAGRFENADFALRFARLMGKAAAPNLIVGRADLESHVVFDDGDEVLRCNDEGMPEDITVSDPTGTFNDYTTPLKAIIKEYAKPINARIGIVPEPMAFVTSYIEALEAELRRIQQEYRKRKRGFDNLFRHRRYDPAGSYAYRWKQVLLRLNATNIQDVMGELSAHIKMPGEHAAV